MTADGTSTTGSPSPPTPGFGASPAAAGSSGQGSMSGGGPAFLRPGAVSPSTATVGFTGATAKVASVPARHYSSMARSPLVHGTVALVSLAVAIVVSRWFLTSDATSADGGPSPFQFVVGSNLLLEGQPWDAGSLDRGRGWWVVLAVAVAVVAVVAWLAQLGRNARFGPGSFGAGVVVLAVPGWWLVPFLVGDSRLDSLGEARWRYGLGLTILLLQALGARWMFTLRLWRSGSLPAPLASFVLWVPHLAAEVMVLGATTYTFFAVGDGERVESSWMPTDLTVRLAIASSRFTAAAVLVVAVVVTVRQHLGIAEDEERQRSLAEARSADAPAF